MLQKLLDAVDGWFRRLGALFRKRHAHYFRDEDTSVWKRRTLRVHVHADDPGHAEQIWQGFLILQRFFGARLTFARVGERAEADIWARADPDLRSGGHCRTVESDDGRFVIRAYVSVSTREPRKTRVACHEAIHALGIPYHSPDDRDMLHEVAFVDRLSDADERTLQRWVEKRDREAPL